MVAADRGCRAGKYSNPGKALDQITEAHFVQQMGWTAEDWVEMVGGWAVGLGLGGSIVGGFLADRFGTKRILALAWVGVVVGWLIFALLPFIDPGQARRELGDPDSTPEAD